MNDPRGLRLLLGALSAVLALIVFLLMMITFVDVLGRELFSLPIPASFEITRLALGLMVFVGLPLVSANDEHVSIGLFNGWFPGRSANWKQLFIGLFVAFLCTAWSRELWIQAAVLAQQNERMMFLKIRLAPFVYAMSVLTFLAAAMHLARAWLKFRGRFRSPETQGV